MKRDKTGSLSLSVNAIVVLIIAITILRLVLAFVRGMFGRRVVWIEEQLEEREAPTATPQIPAANKPTFHHFITIKNEF